MLGRIAPLVTVAACVAALAGHLAAADATSSGAEFPHLRAVSTRADGSVSAVVIEATEPVAYVTSQPDPLTVLVDLRNVSAGGVQAAATARGLTPLRGVHVEESRSADGTPVARVRVSLDRPASHRVRTTRNLIVVEVDQQAPARTATAVASASVTRTAATELRAVRASRSGDEVTVEAGEVGIRFLLVSGKPIKEPVAWYGPIVMNTQAELKLAVAELQAGTFIRA